MADYKEACFVIDSIPDAEYRGFSDGGDWNGFARPYFEYDVAVEVLRASQENGFTWEYQEDTDTFVVWYELQPDDDPEEFGGLTIHVDGRDKKVYGIGAGAWIWEEAEIG